jgi:hypothetical protein
MNRGLGPSARRRRFGLPALLLGLVIGCEPGYDSGCGPPPRSTDAFAPTVQLTTERAPCTAGSEALRGSDPHVLVMFQCPGESDPFLVALKIDGKLLSMKEARGAGYGSIVPVDFGSWEPADSNWHVAEVVLDPLNLFHETDESNNRGTNRLRILTPDAAIDAANCGFVVPYDAGGDGYTLVTQVNQGVPVEVRLVMRYGGPYQEILRSVRSGTVLDASDAVSITSCPSYSSPVFVTRWTPPGPGSYEVEFRIVPVGDTPDDPANDLVKKTLTVLASGARATRGEVTR